MSGNPAVGALTPKKPVSEKITVEQVHDIVRRFWKAMAANDAQTLAHFYTDDATVFNAIGGYPDPGPMSAASCYFGFDSSLQVEIYQLDVRLPGAHGDTAVASYKLRFHRDPEAAPEMEGEDSIEPVECGRVSQVFNRDAQGNLSIIHEHLSMPSESRRKPVGGEAWIDFIQVPA
jgi:ketosteroid isomerase-like protein